MTRGTLSQILSGVVVAIIVGGSSPWWWSEVETLLNDSPRQQSPTSQSDSPTSQKSFKTLENNLADFEEIQELYSNHKQEQTCVAYREIVEKIRLFIGNQRPVPESFRYTVQNVATSGTPNITDLARDRIARIKDVKSGCFP